MVLVRYNSDEGYRSTLEKGKGGEIVTVTAQLVRTTEFRAGAGLLDVLCTAQPGKISVRGEALQSMSEVEDLISALRLAAKEAQLPETRKA
jgi:hypothetical protein